MTMSDRIAVMNLGHYEQLGDPEVLYERPTTRFVAGFLGVSNLLPASIVGRDGAYATAKLSGDATIRVPSALVDGQTSVSIGVRPEKIRLSEESGESPTGYNRLVGVVRDASYLGVSTQYIIESTGGTLTVYEQNVERATRAELWSRGDQVQLTWPPEHSFVVPEVGDGDAEFSRPATPVGTTSV